MSPGQPPRVLLIGPTFSPGSVGGLQLALSDVAAQLTERGWVVDSRIWTAAQNGSADSSDLPWHETFVSSNLAVLHRATLLSNIWTRVPPSIRQMLSTTFSPPAYFEHTSRNMYAADRLLAARDYDLVLLCVDGAPPGMAALVTARHERVVMISLPGLRDELNARWWHWGRLVARCHLGDRIHPLLFRRIAPEEVHQAIFASSQWLEEAVHAGLSPTKALTVYFGVPRAETPPRSSQTHNRILWVGRLSREKGLHLLIRALPAIRQRVGDVTLTIVAGQGSRGYRRLIMAMTRKYHLEEAISWHPPMQRHALESAYASHDLLFFHSIFAEPVALVLMEAFAAGLPVIASRPRVDARLVQDDVTCICYRPDDLQSLIEAVVTMLTSSSIRRRLSATARQLVRSEFSLDGMGQAYDDVLRRCVEQRTAPAEPVDSVRGARE